MGILRIEVGLPASPVSNADILELLQQQSPHLTTDMMVEIAAFFEASGATQRLWRKSEKDPHRLLREMSDRLFCHIDKKNIDIVIWCGVTKYFAEPAHASIFCQLAGIRPKIAFDVSDGCMGWLTSLSLLNAMGASGKKGYALIVSHEFPMGQNGAIFPKSFQIAKREQLKYKLPAFTLGEACTATLVELEEASDPTMRLELPEGAQLCTMPYRNFKDFLWESPFINSHEEFQSHYGDMSKAAAKKSISALNSTIVENNINLVPHSYTRSFEKLKRFLEFEANIVNYFDEYGNTATSSLPLNIAIGCMRGDLDPQKPTYAWCASAGIKVAIAKINISASLCN